MADEKKDKREFDEPESKRDPSYEGEPEGEGVTPEPKGPAAEDGEGVTPEPK